MSKKEIRNSLLLVLAALIWGAAFVAQTTGGDAVGPYSFNSIRMLIGAVVLVPVICITDMREKKKRTKKQRTEETCERKDTKTLFIGGICCGVVLFVASNLQQVGITMGVSSGKAGFLTACYILLVPVFGLLFKKKCGLNVWIGVVLAVAGLYLLCMNGSISLQLRDICVLLCAVCFAVHILAVDYFSPRTDGVRLSCLQFLTCGLLGVIPTVGVDMAKIGVNEWIRALMSIQAWIPILYAGVMSCGIAYTLQIIGQDGLNPTVASLLMSLESVFAALAGWVILRQILSGKEIMGCLLIFVAIVLAQIDFKSVKGKETLT